MKSNFFFDKNHIDEEKNVDENHVDEEKSSSELTVENWGDNPLVTAPSHLDDDDGDNDGDDDGDGDDDDDGDGDGDGNDDEYNCRLPLDRIFFTF